MSKGFGKGFLAGIASTVALAAGAIFTVHKTIIEPEEKKEAFIEENRFFGTLNQTRNTLV